MSVPLPSTFACPQCQQSDQVQKVSALVGDGSSPGEHPVVPGMPFAILAERLAPPEEPQLSGMLSPGEVVATIVMALIAFPAFGLAFEAFRETRSLMAQDTSDPLAAPLVTWWKIVLFASVFVFVLCLVSFAVTSQRYFQRQAADRSSREQWSSARAKWEQLHYCGRCNGVFIPGGDPHLVAVNQMPEFVYE